MRISIWKWVISVRQVGWMVLLIENDSDRIYLYRASLNYRNNMNITITIKIIFTKSRQKMFSFTLSSLPSFKHMGKVKTFQTNVCNTKEKSMNSLHKTCLIREKSLSRKRIWHSWELFMRSNRYFVEQHCTQTL